MEMTEAKEMADTLFENENYKVIVRRQPEGKGAWSDGSPYLNADPMYITVDDVAYTSWYEVVNSATGIVELRTPCLPEAIYKSSLFNRTLVTKSWEALFISQDGTAVEPPPTSNFNIN